MGSPKRSKAWGYEVERRTLALLKRAYTAMRRTGSMAYKSHAADLVDDVDNVAVQVKGRESTWVGSLYREAKKANKGCRVYVVTKDKRGPLLVTMELKAYVETLEGIKTRVDAAFELGRLRQSIAPEVPRRDS